MWLSRKNARGDRLSGAKRGCKSLCKLESCPTPAFCSCITKQLISVGLPRVSFLDDMHKECIRRRNKWLNFVSLGRAGWEPTRHFKREDFTQMFTLLLDQKTSPWLKEDNLVPCVFPSIQARNPEFRGPTTKPQSAQTKRVINMKVRNSCIAHGNSLFMSVLFKIVRDAVVNEHKTSSTGEKNSTKGDRNSTE